MDVGLSKSAIASIVMRELSTNQIIEASQIAKAIAVAISKNNRELEKEFKSIRDEID